MSNGQIVLVSTSNVGKTIRNVFTVSWVTPVSLIPPLFSICVGKDNFSYSLIKNSKEFVINVPTADLKEIALKAGTLHGDKIDKIEKLKLTATKAKTVEAPLIKECILNIECKVIQELELGNQMLFIAEASAIHCDEGVITEKGFDEKYKKKQNFVYYFDVRGKTI